MKLNHLAQRKLVPLLLTLGVLGGCEAPLDLSGIEQQQNQATRRFDQFKSAAHTDDRIVVVGDHGVVLTSRDQGESWSRLELSGYPALVDVTACPDGSVVALDRSRKVWVSDTNGSGNEYWASRGITTEEEPLAIDCDPEGHLWVTASFSTILHSDDKGLGWASQSLDEDMQLGTIQFLDRDSAVITGEFGALLKSIDGGRTWQRQADLPDEFFPLAAHFADTDTGWVSGLGGTVLHTRDGGQSWEKQSTASVSPLYGLISNGPELYAAGDSGTLLQYDGANWNPVAHNTGVRSYFIAMAALNRDQLLVAGGAGLVSVIDVTQDVTKPHDNHNVLAEKLNERTEGATL
jgi:photosystem II stability/assembly factor-like uncharacterized protein